MWKRWDLKERARQNIRRNYWQTVLVSFLFLLISNGRSVVFSGRSAHTTHPQSYISYAIGMAAATIMPLIFLGISLFIFSPLQVDGEKWNAFVMALSFFGWIFLGAVSGGIVMIFYTTPYGNAAFAELYTVLKQKIHG